MKRMSGKRLAAVLLVMLCTCALAAADVSGINIMGIRLAADAPQLYLEVRALDSTGAGVRVQPDGFRFAAGDTELAARQMAGSNLGHIIVVDTSLYYYGSQYVKPEHIQGIVTAYLSRLSSDERIMFVLTTNAARPTCTNYMSLEEARQTAQGIAFTQETSARINSAIYEAFQYAISPAAGAPMFNSVFIVADPDLASNSDDEHSLSECAQLRANSGLSFDVAVAVPYREQYINATNATRRKALQDGLSAFQQFAQQAGGKYLQLPQSNSGVDTDELHASLAAWTYTTGCYEVDLSALSGLLPAQPQVQTVQIAVTCTDAGGNAVRTVDVPLDVSLLPEPEATPTPEITPEPTPEATPAPTPVVAVGQADSAAMQAIYALSQLNYLDMSRYDEFDNNCFLAYIDFCRNNGIDPLDGIYADTYALLLSGEAVGAPVTTPEPTATPAPTPTPVPTVPPDGYAVNDADTEDSGGYIAQMQAILKALNCYEAGAASNVGRLDQATVNAINRYCEAFNWRNDHVDGVSKQIVEEILTNGTKLNPLADEEPSLQEKARAFLRRELTVGSVTVHMWAPVIACVLLLFLIIVIAVLRGGRNREEPVPAPAPAPAPAPTPKPERRDPGSDPGDETEGKTADPYFRKFVTLYISYAGQSRVEEIELNGREPYTIGRKDCNLTLDSADKEASRRHAELIYRNDQVYVRDLSSYGNTSVNGVRVRGRSDAGGADGVIVNNGDVLQAGNHMITVRW